MLEVPATADGVLSEIRIAPGATVKAGDIIGILVEGAAGSAAPAAKSDAPKAAAADDAQSPAVRKLILVDNPARLCRF